MIIKRGDIFEIEYVREKEIEIDRDKKKKEEKVNSVSLPDYPIYNFL